MRSKDPYGQPGKQSSPAFTALNSLFLRPDTLTANRRAKDMVPCRV